MYTGARDFAAIFKTNTAIHISYWGDRLLRNRLTFFDSYDFLIERKKLTKQNKHTTVESYWMYSIKHVCEWVKREIPEKEKEKEKDIWRKVFYVRGLKHKEGLCVQLRWEGKGDTQEGRYNKSCGAF